MRKGSQTSRLKPGDRRRLAKVLVIDTEKVLQLRKARETADAIKAAKAAGKQRGQKKEYYRWYGTANYSNKKKKVVMIKKDGEVYSTGSSIKALE